MPSLFQKHAARWNNCRSCPLCEGRRHVVLARGVVPCDVLFIGEAPGASEDVLGAPFMGPAGKLLDRIIAEAVDSIFVGGCARMKDDEPRIAFTNLVCCVPRGDDGDKVAEPPKEAIKACQPRLKEFIALARPKLVVCVGGLATKWVKSGRDDLGLGEVPIIEIVHPAAILRANIAQQGLAMQRAVVMLATAIEDHISGKGAKP
jgi:DNA polymerase